MTEKDTVLVLEILETNSSTYSEEALKKFLKPLKV